MSDAGGDGDVGGDDGAGEGFVVEGPEVFEGAAAADEENQIDSFEFRVSGFEFFVVGVEVFEGRDDFFGGVFALDADGVEEDVEAGEAAVGGGEDVVEDVAGFAGDDGDALGEFGEWAFAGLFEEAFGFEFVAELAEGEFEAAGALGEEGFDVELEFALGFVEFEGAAGDDGEAIFGFEFESGEGIFPEDAGEFGAGFF